MCIRDRIYFIQRTGELSIVINIIDKKKTRGECGMAQIPWFFFLETFLRLPF